MNEHNDILKALRQQMKEDNRSEGYPLHTPQDYFPGLENRILSKVLEENTFLTLPDDGKEPTFTVPVGYFEGLEKEILKKTASPAPVRKLFSYRWRAIAAAAVIGVLIGGGIYYREVSNSQQITIQNGAGGSGVIHNISSNELTDFVEDGAAGNGNSSDKKKPVDINQLFQQVSSQDLESFLNETAVNNTELF
ncbi:MAG TPA: hypothetical protein VL943_05515 [Niabella sp.]|nr:hypothetical protein [Niabella sp.]